MGKIGRWVTIVAVIGALALLAVVLYLLLEPFHRDDDSGEAVAVVVGYAAAPVATPAREQLSRATQVPRRAPIPPAPRHSGAILLSPHTS